jgi:ketose-bisphosphate aldolase
LITSFAEMLAERSAAGAALGAFTCYGMEGAVGVLRAAEDRGVPVMLLMSAQAYESQMGDALLGVLLTLAGEASVPACVQLDHVSARVSIARALTAGVGAVMADGSHLGYDKNVALTRSVVGRGVGVEGELGHIAGNEELAAARRAGALTDPTEAAEFVAATGVDCLAVSIGNVHGDYVGTPSLDLARLAEIRRRVSIPLSLHGASGLPNAVVRACIAGGVAKVNVNTELRRRYLDTVAERLPDVHRGLRLLDLGCALADAIAAVAAEKLALFDPP